MSSKEISFPIFVFPLNSISPADKIIVLDNGEMVGIGKHKDLLKNFILKCQDDELGGIGDRPGNCHDVFHTFFGLCGLSLLGYPGLNLIDPTYAIPVSDVKNVLGKKE